MTVKWRPCWAFRYETYGDDPWVCLDQAPPCPHESDGEDHEYDFCPWDWAHEMCCLSQGHDGPHEFVTQDEIVLTFAGE